MLFGFVCSQHGFGDMAWTCWAWQEVLRALTAFDSNIQRLDFLSLHVWGQKPLMRKLLSLCLRNVMQHLSPSLPAESFTGDLTSAFFPPFSVRAPTSRACCEIETLAARRVQIYMQKHTLSCWRRGTGWVGNEWVWQHCIFHWWTAESLQEASLPLSGHFDEVESAFDAVRLSATQKKREAYLQNFSAPPGCLELRLSTTSSQGHFVSRCNDEVQRMVSFRVM